MKTIWKYSIPVNDFSIIRMPLGAEILCVQVQFGDPCIWALVDPDNELEERHFETFGTGHPIFGDFERKYIGTYQVHGGNLVFHLFEKI